jgi:predicted nucleic acid-binding protein
MAAASHPLGLIDTDILVDEARGVAAAATFLNEQRSLGLLQVSVITAMELVRGCRNAADLRQVRRMLARFIVLQVSDAASQAAFQFIDALYLSHGLAIPDALIAATAVDHGLPLYTKNVRHFQAIPGLVAIRPY